jgi:acyl-coenzyme A thioesterase PaaI-like protein
LRAGRRIVTVSIEVTNERGELTATALTTYARKG